MPDSTDPTSNTPDVNGGENPGPKPTPDPVVAFGDMFATVPASTPSPLDPRIIAAQVAFIRACGPGVDLGAVIALVGGLAVTDSSGANTFGMALDAAASAANVTAPDSIAIDLATASGALANIFATVAALSPSTASAQ